MFGGAGGTHFPHRAQKAQACKIKAPGGESRNAAAVVVNFMAVSSYRKDYRDKNILSCIFVTVMYRVICRLFATYDHKYLPRKLYVNVKKITIHFPGFSVYRVPNHFRKSAAHVFDTGGTLRFVPYKWLHQMDDASGILLLLPDGIADEEAGAGFLSILHIQDILAALLNRTLRSQTRRLLP